MITITASKVQEQLKTLSDLQLAQGKLVDINDTLTRLNAVLSAARSLISSYGLIASRLPGSAKQDITGQVQRIAAIVMTSHIDFHSNKRQVAQLSNAENSISSAQTALRQHWTTYALGQTAPLNVIVSLIRYLPKLAPQLPAIEVAQTFLTGASNVIPSETTLAKFDANLATLRTAISTVQDLSPAIIDFMEKVAGRQASVADLTTQTLQWLSQDGRAHAFKIRFDT